MLKLHFAIPDWRGCTADRCQEREASAHSHHGVHLLWACWNRGGMRARNPGFSCTMLHWEVHLSGWWWSIHPKVCRCLFREAGHGQETPRKRFRSDAAFLPFMQLFSQSCCQCWRAGATTCSWFIFYKLSCQFLQISQGDVPQLLLL